MQRLASTGGEARAWVNGPCGFLQRENAVANRWERKEHPAERYRANWRHASTLLEDRMSINRSFLSLLVANNCSLCHQDPGVEAFQKATSRPRDYRTHIAVNIQLQPSVR